MFPEPEAMMVSKLGPSQQSHNFRFSLLLVQLNMQTVPETNSSPLNTTSFEDEYAL